MITEVAYSDGILRAEIDSVERVLTVYRSVLCGQHDPLYQPVAEVLANDCSMLIDVERRQDDTACLGQVVITQTLLLDDCPGPSVVHRCHSVAGRDEEVRGFGRTAGEETAAVFGISA